MHMPEHLNCKPFKSAGYPFLYKFLLTLVYNNIKATVLSLDTELLKQLENFPTNLIRSPLKIAALREAAGRCYKRNILPAVTTGINCCNCLLIFLS